MTMMREYNAAIIIAMAVLYTVAFIIVGSYDSDTTGDTNCNRCGNALPVIHDPVTLGIFLVPLMVLATVGMVLYGRSKYDD